MMDQHFHHQQPLLGAEEGLTDKGRAVAIVPGDHAAGEEFQADLTNGAGDALVQPLLERCDTRRGSASSHAP